MYKNKLKSWFTLVVLGAALLTLGCDKKNIKTTVSQEEIKKEVAKLEKLKKDGKLASTLQKEYGESFEILSLPGNGLPLSRKFIALEKAGNNYRVELKKLKAISEKSNTKLEELAKAIISVRKAKKIYDRECEKSELTK